MKVSHMITLAFSTPCVFKLVTLFSFSLTGSHNQIILLHINSGPTKFYKMNEKYNMISIINFTMSIKIIAFLDLLQIYNQASNHMVFIRPLYDLESMTTYADDNYLGSENHCLNLALAHTKEKIENI